MYYRDVPLFKKQSVVDKVRRQVWSPSYSWKVLFDAAC